MSERSDYDPRNALKKSPEELRDWVLTLLAVVVVVWPNWDPDGALVGVLGLFIYKTLTVFYVKPAQKAAVEEAKQDVIAIQNEIDRKVAEATPPAVVVEEAGEVKVEGDAVEQQPQRPKRVQK